MWKTDFKTLTELLDSDRENATSTINTQIIYEDSCSFMEAEINAIYIPELKLELHEGTFWQKDSTGEFYPDWAFTSINKINRPMSEYLYVEQGGYYSALHNYAHIAGCAGLNIDDLIAIFKPVHDLEPTVLKYRRLFNT